MDSEEGADAIAVLAIEIEAVCALDLVVGAGYVRRGR
jgi:histidinol dehydrogenase